ncbi:hypothetical protein [Saccharopolyspora hattusasensis]|uniref:hypothetical protein n=1 Tax=Saccharopolyspora hattusasensis TaxID=1128679 RepID=UPI003D961ECC
MSEIHESIWAKAAEVASPQRVWDVKGSAWDITSLIEEVVRAVVPLAVENELRASLLRGLADTAAGHVTRRDDYLEGDDDAEWKKLADWRFGALTDMRARAEKAEAELATARHNLTQERYEFQEIAELVGAKGAGPAFTTAYVRNVVDELAELREAHKAMYSRAFDAEANAENQLVRAEKAEAELERERRRAEGRELREYRPQRARVVWEDIDSPTPPVEDDSATVEKVARAIYNGHGGVLPEQESHYQMWANGYRDMARTALAALKEDTDA